MKMTELKKNQRNKPYFRSKGKYTDGRKKVVLEWTRDGKLYVKFLPKPEKLWELLESLEKQEKVEKNSLPEAQYSNILP